MNRYHLGILFSAIALILFSGISLRHEYVSRKQAADRQTEEVLKFATSCAMGVLSHEYGGSRDYHSVSDNFFKALALMEEGQSVLEGRVAPEDFYPYVPVLICLEERYYHIGFYDGVAYQWSEARYYPDSRTKAETDGGLLLDSLEQDIGSALAEYHGKRGIPDTKYLMPDYISRNLASSNTATMLAVLENFPTDLYGYAYSGTCSAGGLLKELPDTGGGIGIRVFSRERRFPKRRGNEEGLCTENYFLIYPRFQPDMPYMTMGLTLPPG